MVIDPIRSKTNTPITINNGVEDVLSPLHVESEITIGVILEPFEVGWIIRSSVIAALCESITVNVVVIKGSVAVLLISSGLVGTIIVVVITGKTVVVGETVIYNILYKFQHVYDSIL